MSKAQQADLSQYVAGTTTEPVVRTIKCPLATSNRTRERVQECVDAWQEVLEWAYAIMPSLPAHGWSRQNTTLYRMVGEEFPNNNGLGAHDAREAAYKVAEAFDAWESNGQPGERPQYSRGEFLRLRDTSFNAERSDGVLGLKVGLQPYNPEWFRIEAADYHRKHLQRVVDGEATLGAGELRIEGDTVYAHLTVKDDVEVYKPADVSRHVGVDLGENVLFTAAVVGNDVEAVEMESGREFRHYRERLKERQQRLQERGDLRGVKQNRGEYERYTEHVTNTATKRIVDLAREHAPCAIRLEEMGDYRETSPDPIHDWPRGMIVEQICYKATVAGIPVEFVDPAYTSQTCRKCGQTDDAARDGAEFHCRRCGYEVHADVNAAINIAQRSP